MNIVLGVSGGIAAYKAVLLARLLAEAGHELHVVPTADALRFVGKPTWEAISGNPVTVSVHDDVPEVRHVALGQRADAVVVAPATANTLARMASGLADDLLGTTLLATRAPVLVAPAMHTEMWEHPATQHNIDVLRRRGVHVVGPESGRLTGSDTGPGRMSEPEAIAASVEQLLAAGDLSGRKILVTAGGTREPIDPVRYIGNRSSGKQGVSLAAAAAARGAQVVLVACNIDRDTLREAETDPRVRVVRAGSARDLQWEIDRQLPDCDTLIMAAAVSDYRVLEVSEGKLRKEEGTPSLQLTENPDILRGTAAARTGASPLLVGFAAETVDSERELFDRAARKLERKGADILVANAVGWDEGFEQETNTVQILGRGGARLGAASGAKREVADAVLDAILAVDARDRVSEPE